MKKLAIVGIVLAGLLVPTATAQGKPAGMTKSESLALNQRYGVDQMSQSALRGKLMEIGAWAVPSQKPLARPSKQTIIRQKLEEIGAWAVPSTSTQSSKVLVSEKLSGLGLPTLGTTTVASSGNEFDWNDAGIGAAFVFGAVLLGAASLMTVRRHQHGPIAH